MHNGKLITHLGPLIMLVAGLTFAFGAVASLDLGSFRRMGPGAFPLLVGALLAVLAAIGLVQNLRAPMATEKADPIAVLGVVAGVSAFAFLTPLLGVLPATAVAVFATGSAIPGFRWPLRAALAVGVAIGVWLIFVRGLGMPFVAIRGI
ncbi:tripartite tricarboxylate transporter TctB family protein [Marinovum sp. 2_MG-2023]|uniref:tripartite tricarboxylate transporter TctB family protein n=1 Tax=Roseobacteraceae TaxID=2854170 RepID=UPI001FD04927|nr:MULTISPECIES: tripartite tricarboxylate transporter TctB family protein [Roseobacteraceae]MCJ7870932.1 tripartite tricarboxylate transporter TctB family protein [Phaeobacter sp. J2-8]MDO6730534.1 tripartite tricarboxylate transporter TctB family protein [Marinovum sp. 2_MG-2023]MDO6778684.1 tripartite tricarboxylate transporter TctB family protein [Marinovum sp. 1_MG-2023]